MIRESVRFLTENGRRVIFDAEHFFDGFLDDRAFAMRAAQAAVEGGAETVCLCDTNGGVFPRTQSTSSRTPRRTSACPSRCISTTTAAWRSRTASSRSRGRRAGAGHVPRLRRAVRQREPLGDHPGSAAQARHSVHPAGEHRASDALRARARVDRKCRCARRHAVCRQPRVHAQGRHARGRRHQGAAVV